MPMQNGSRHALRSSAALVLAIAFGCAAHSSQDERDERDPTAEPSATTLADFSEGRWSLRIDRAWNGSTQVKLPTDMLSEGDYDAAPASELPVLVSANASSVAVGPEPMTGARSRTSTATQLAFDLTQGTFAGGRFLVWQEDDGLQAELTVYGSGRPIVESKRGALVRSQ